MKQNPFLLAMGLLLTSVSVFAAAAPLSQPMNPGTTVAQPGNPGTTVNQPGNPGTTVAQPGNPGTTVNQPGNPGLTDTLSNGRAAPRSYPSATP